MKYKIGDLAYLFNLSPESIRHYERQGIVHPQKAEGSSYRYYDAWDLAVLSACRQYRALGFSLENSAQLIKEDAPVSIFENMRRRESDIEEEIARQCHMLKAIRAWRREAEASYALVGRFELAENVPTCFLPYQYGDALVRDEARLNCVREWLSQIPYVYVGMLLKQNENSQIVGLGMAQTGMEVLKPPIDPGMIRIPSRLCLHTAFCLEKLDTAQMQREIRQETDARGFQPTGDLFCRFNIISVDGESLGGVLDCFQPIE